ncbi:hypothetical protein THAOC_11857, partial [Thalassiosira oceanica]
LPPHVRGVLERAEERDEVVQQEYPEAVGHDEVALHEVYAQEDEGQRDGERHPPRENVYGGLVEPILHRAFD